jgi:hypothetical protein
MLILGESFNKDLICTLFIWWYSSYLYKYLKKKTKTKYINKLFLLTYHGKETLMLMCSNHYYVKTRKKEKKKEMTNSTLECFH